MTIEAKTKINYFQAAAVGVVAIAVGYTQPESLLGTAGTALVCSLGIKGISTVATHLKTFYDIKSQRLAPLFRKDPEPNLVERAFLRIKKHPSYPLFQRFKITEASFIPFAKRTPFADEKEVLDSFKESFSIGTCAGQVEELFRTMKTVKDRTTMQFLNTENVYYYQMLSDIQIKLNDQIRLLHEEEVRSRLQNNYSQIDALCEERAHLRETILTIDPDFEETSPSILAHDIKCYRKFLELLIFHKNIPKGVEVRGKVFAVAADNKLGHVIYFEYVENSFCFYDPREGLYKYTNKQDFFEALKRNLIDLFGPQGTFKFSIRS